MKTKLFALKKICAPLLLSACFVPALGAAETHVTNGAGIAWTGYRSNTATVFAFDAETGTYLCYETGSTTAGRTRRRRRERLFRASSKARGA